MFVHARAVRHGAGAIARHEIMYSHISISLRESVAIRHIIISAIVFKRLQIAKNVSGCKPELIELRFKYIPRIAEIERTLLSAWPSARGPDHPQASR